MSVLPHLLSFCLIEFEANANDEASYFIEIK